eukprot:Awhi_evm1s8536
MLPKIVPWASNKEWEELYENIFSGNNERERLGLQGLDVWACRGRLPTAIDCTRALLNAFHGNNSFENN